MRRQKDLDKYNNDLQWDKFIDRIMWAPCIIIMFLIGAYIYALLMSFFSVIDVKCLLLKANKKQELGSPTIQK